MQQSISAFPPTEFATKLLLSLGIGLLVGFEREWSHKDLGVRTFAITSLLGMLAALISAEFLLASFAGIVVLASLVNVNSIRSQKSLEITTSAALLVTFSLGVLVGQGHIFTPAASAIVMTLLLALKPQLARFAGGLTQEEVRGAVLLGLIGFVIYPVLPNRFIDRFHLFNPREAWLTVIVIASIGFLNYVLLRLYSSRGLYYTAVFGGLVNSTAAIAQLIGPVAAAGPDARPVVIVVSLLTIVAMFVRNLALLLIFSPTAGSFAALPILVMVTIAAGFVWSRRRARVETARLAIGSPISVRQLASFGLIFVVIQAASTLGQRFLGQYGAVLASAIGGFASSASSTAAIASLSEHAQVLPMTAAVATVLASVASTLINLPITYRETKDRDLIRGLMLISSLITVFGLASLELLNIYNSKLK